ncbi:hypothetical protein BJ166DRAFT_135416 [Pestalotiopsis sp. NC0098]|nr:hypothetical protein BJ166DRAFT_135416 [Pestalotiopsis sp. NC0098]
MMPLPSNYTMHASYVPSVVPPYCCAAAARQTGTAKPRDEMNPTPAAFLPLLYDFQGSFLPFCNGGPSCPTWPHTCSKYIQSDHLLTAAMTEHDMPLDPVPACLPTYLTYRPHPTLLAFLPYSLTYACPCTYYVVCGARRAHRRSAPPLGGWALMVCYPSSFPRKKCTWILLDRLLFLYKYVVAVSFFLSVFVFLPVEFADFHHKAEYTSISYIYSTQA